MKVIDNFQLLLAMAFSQGLLCSCANIGQDNGLKGTTTEIDPTEIASAVAIEPLGELSFRVLHKADYNIDDRQTSKDFIVISEAEGYAAELQKYSIEFPASIDFDSQTIVLATMGTQPSGGYSISATSALEYESRVVLKFELLSPAGDCLTTQALSNPYEFVLLPTKKSIDFAESLRVQSCEQ